MANWNRTRSRDLGSKTTLQTVMYNAHYPTKEGTYQVYKTSGGSLVRKEQIKDITPVGKFQEGVFKVTDVERCKVFQESDSFSVKGFISGSQTVPYWKVEGEFNFPLSFSPQTSIPASPAFVNSDIDNLCRSALASVNSPSIGLGETFAEAEAGLKMLRSPMTGLRDLLTKSLFAKKGGRLNRRSLKDASSAWLEYRYGWYPLVLTIKDTIMNMPDELTSKHVLREAAKQEATSVLDHSTVNGYSKVALTFKSAGTTITKVVKRGVVYYRVHDGKAFRRQKLGLDLVYAPQLLYELTRLSFALDWWYNLGDWIAANVPNPYITILGYTFSEKRDITNQSTLTRIEVHDGGYVMWPHAVFREQLQTYRREVVTPNVSALPTLDYDFHSLKHVVDALGLIIQQIPKGSKTRR